MVREAILFNREECEFLINSASGYYDSMVNHGYVSNVRTSLEADIEIKGEVKELLLQKLSSFGVQTLPETFKVIKYRVGGEFFRHKDNSSKHNADRYMSVSIQLSDTYEGGDLSVWENDTKFTASKAIGNTVMFNSGLSHQAFPVELGTRYAGVIWLSLENMGKTRVLL